MALMTPQFYSSSSSQLHSEPRSLSRKPITGYSVELKISLHELPVCSPQTKGKKSFRNHFEGLFIKGLKQSERRWETYYPKSTESTVNSLFPGEYT